MYDRALPHSLRLVAAGVLLALAGVALAGAAAAQPKLPSADEVLARYVEALGGEAAIRSHRSMSLAGRVEVPAMRLEGRIEHRSAAPDRYLLIYSVPGLAEQHEGYTGEVGWRLHGGTYPRLIEGRELEKMLRTADFYPELRYAQHFPTREALGVEKFAGEECYKLRLATDYDDEVIEYFDTDTGLLLGRESWNGPPAERFQVVDTVLEYRQVGGRLLPVKISQRGGGIEQIIEFSTIELDAVGDAELVPPEPVTKLLAK